MCCPAVVSGRSALEIAVIRPEGLRKVSVTRVMYTRNKVAYPAPAVAAAFVSIYKETLVAGKGSAGGYYAFLKGNQCV